MKNFLYNIRFYVLCTSVLVSLIIYILVSQMIAPGYPQVVALEEWYGFLSLLFLYVTLLAGPFCYTFHKFLYRKQYLNARRALGVSAFYFAYLHTSISLFGQLGGFSGLGFLDTSILYAVILGAIALFIMLLLTITSFDFAVDKLTFPKWKLLHRFVYLAGILILLHVALIGNHFSNLSGIIPQITFIALAFLLLLEAPRFDKFLKKFIHIPTLSFSTAITVIILVVLYFVVIDPVIGSGGASLDVHAAHEHEAAQLLQSQQNNSQLNANSTQQYTVSMSTDPPNPQPNQDTTLYFTVYNAITGDQATSFNTLYAKQMHMTAVNNELTYFSHLLPVYSEVGGNFAITTQFPQNGIYHLYLQFQPSNSAVQQDAFTLPVGQVSSTQKIIHTNPDTNKTKIYGKYAVSINTNGELSATQLSKGAQTISYTITYAKSKKPLTKLQSYLGYVGQLTLINENTLAIIHVQPTQFAVPPSGSNKGVSVFFSPSPQYDKITPGIYRAFAEFNPDNHLFTADYTVKIN